MLVPQLTLYTPAEVQALLSPPVQNKRAAFLPILVGLSLAVSAVEAGISGGALGHPLWAVQDLNSKLEQALTSTAESLASLQRQVTSLAQVTLQNLRAIDLFTAEKGGTSLFLREECCYYINESGLVETNVVKLTDLATSLKNPPNQNPFATFFLAHFQSWLLPLLGPICLLFPMCLFLPCLLHFLQGQLRKISNQTFNQLLLRYYQPLMTNEPPTSSREQLTHC